MTYINIISHPEKKREIVSELEKICGIREVAQEITNKVFKKEKIDWQKLKLSKQHILNLAYFLVDLDERLGEKSVAG